MHTHIVDEADPTAPTAPGRKSARASAAAARLGHRYRDARGDAEHNVVRLIHRDGSPPGRPSDGEPQRNLDPHEYVTSLFSNGSSEQHTDVRASAVATEVRRGRDDRRLSVRNLVLRAALSGVAALLVVGVVTAYASRKIALDTAIGEARRTTLQKTALVVQPLLGDDILSGDPASLQRLDEVVRRQVLDESLVRVKIWDEAGTVIYSDDPRLIGRQFELGGPEAAVFAGRDPVAHVSDLSAPENRLESAKKLLEVYVRSSTREGTPLLVEAYFRYSGVSASGWKLWWRFAPIALGALIVIELIQIPLMWRLATRLRRGQLLRRRLVDHAIEASNAEKRRIVTDLHDGVVQDLVGVSLSLAAASRGTKQPDPLLVDASATIRQSVKALRSLLVDIYPPTLWEEGIESALEELLDQVARQNITTSLMVDLDDEALDQPTAELLYRSTQEALRNVVAHSRAKTVHVELIVRGRSATLSIEDDGQGFDRERWRQQVVRGHFGLRGLCDLVRDAGGRMAVSSDVGRGTHVSVKLPLPSTERDAD
jgi:two-component system, NarL family, sensor kinase